MTPSVPEALLARDAESSRDLDIRRRRALDRELRSPGVWLWRSVAAAWIVIGLLRWLTPPPRPVDPRNTEMARIGRLLGAEVAWAQAKPDEPRAEIRIP